MLLVNARRGPSRVHGVGLIALEFIPKGARIWEFRPGFDALVSEADAAQLSAKAQRDLHYWTYFDLAQRQFVLSGDDDRFTNHSPEPNTRVISGDHTEAARDIVAGEEITSDYREFGWTPFLGVPPGSPASAPVTVVPYAHGPSPEPPSVPLDG